MRRSTANAAQLRLKAATTLQSPSHATNYVVLERGQPLHPFDMALLEGPGIVVRRAGEGERLLTLDEVEREAVGPARPDRKRAGRLRDRKRHNDETRRDQRARQRPTE